MCIGPVRVSGEVRRRVGGPACGRDDQDQSGRAVRVAERELDGGQRTSRSTGDRDFLQLQLVEQIDEGVGLAFGRRVGGPAAAQIAETRRGDDPDTVADHALGKGEALVEATASAVDHQQRRAAALVS